MGKRSNLRLKRGCFKEINRVKRRVATIARAIKSDGGITRKELLRYSPFVLRNCKTTDKFLLIKSYLYSIILKNGFVKANSPTQNVYCKNIGNMPDERMGKMKYYLAVDIGASSGRHMLASVQDGKIVLEEVYRFKNFLDERNGHLCWSIDRLFNEIKNGLKKCREIGKIPTSMGIDTWGVDYVLLDKDDKILGDTIAYRDSRTNGIPEMIYKNIISKSDLYKRTGIQEQPFNTIFQLMAVKEQAPEILDAAESWLMLPCYFNFLLTGIKMNEYTNASTTGLLDAEKKDWDRELISKLGLPDKLFTPLHMPTERVGAFTKEIAQEVGFECEVVLPGTHDTASAVLAVPMENGEGVYISSGTWSLMGVENKAPICTDESSAEGLSNEGGIEYRFRYLKNIMGLWIIQSIKRELNDKYSFPELSDFARQEQNFKSEIDVNDISFLAPKSMTEAIKNYCKNHGSDVPQNLGQLMQCVYVSLSKCYAESVSSIEKIMGKTYDCIRIVGGGCQDNYLNEMTAKMTGKTVYAGPIEATALGNISAQLLHDKAVGDIEAVRALIRRSFPIKTVK